LNFGHRIARLELKKEAETWIGLDAFGIEGREEALLDGAWCINATLNTLLLLKDLVSFADMKLDFLLHHGRMLRALGCNGRYMQGVFFDPSVQSKAVSAALH
jgi:hypothetical protein